ncbi:DUF4407 domain-containing protein [Micromonospora wenchangensis]|uniref:DUF4407 domain-containing protein n=1 Tax=Micromonospora wenchangensis TaxID=1185415 RepID=UPI003D75F5A3
MSERPVSYEATERLDTYQPGRAARFLLWCGGADPTLLETRVEYYRAAGVGLFILIIAFLGAITFGLYASVVAGRFQLWFIPFALFWGVLIFVVDRSIVVDPSYGSLRRVERHAGRTGPAVESPWPPRPDGTARQADPPWPGERGMESGRAARPVMYLARLGMAVVVALLIAEVVVLLIFQPEIRRELAGQARQSYTATLLTLATAQSTQLQVQIDEDRRTMRANEEKVTAAKTEMDAAYQRYNLEVSGEGGSGDRGYGRAAEQLWRNYEQWESRYRQAQATRDRVNGGLQRDIDGLLRRQRELKTPGSGAYLDLEGTEVARQVRAEGAMVDGWLAQERAFRAFQQRNRDDWAVVWTPWLVRLLLVLIDLLPLSLKISTGSTIYGRRLRDRAARIRYADRALHHARLSDVQHAADLHAYRVGLTTRLHYDDDERYHGRHTYQQHRDHPAREEES